MRTRTVTILASRALTVFLALVLVQGFHEIEHIVQVVQRALLGIPDGNGLLGSLTDIEPLHFAYNSLYLALLVAVFVSLGLHRHGPSEHGPLVAGLVTFALAFQMWHELEHVFKLVQYVGLGVNGTGGILGRGPGGLVPLFPVPILHLAYNTVTYLPALAAFIALVRRLPAPAATRARPDAAQLRAAAGDPRATRPTRCRTALSNERTREGQRLDKVLPLAIARSPLARDREREAQGPMQVSEPRV